MRRIIQEINGKRAMQLACGEVKFYPRKPEKQYQLTGNRKGRRDIHIGPLCRMKWFMEKWKAEGVTNLILAERIEDETGLRLIEMR